MMLETNNTPIRIENRLRKIHLHGELKNHLPNGFFECVWSHPREAASAIESNFPGFRKLLKDKKVEVWYSNKDGKNIPLNEEQLLLKIGGDELHIAPVPEGSGRYGKVILGVALFAVGLGAAALAGGGLVAGLGAAAPGFLGSSLGLTAGNLVLAGGLMILNGLLAPQVPKGDFSKNEEERKPSAIYRGPLNTQEQGTAFPLVFGFGVISGGAVIHADLQIGKVPVA